MSRARVVCSKILNRLSAVSQHEQLTVMSDQDLISKLSVYNLTPEQSTTGNILSTTLCPTVINSEMDEQSETQEDECNSMVDNWLEKSDISMECCDDGFLESAGLDLGQINKKNNRVAIVSDNLVLNNSVDPLLNVPGEVSLTFTSGDTAKDLTVPDCDNSIYKSKMWDTLSVASRKSDSDKNSDFIDFNLLPYTFDPSDLIESVNEKTIETSTVSFEFESDVPFDSILIQDASKLPLEINKFLKASNSNKTSKSQAKKVKKDSDVDPMLTTPGRIDKNMNVNEIYKNALNENGETQDATLFEINTVDLLPQIVQDNPSDGELNLSAEDLTSALEPILNQSANNFDNLAEEEARIMKTHRISELENMVGVVAVVTNSTINQAKPKTKILIKTDKGDERYEGYTADLMIPLSNNNKKDKNPVTPALGKHIITSIETAASIKEGPNTPLYREEPEDDIIKEMLDVLGITNDMLYTILTNLNLRVWICPEHECRKIYNRLHTLKTHILSHYGLKPYKCDYPNCPWSFYTSFKLKRHKETHEKKKNFQCSVSGCNRSFTTIYNLNTHIKLHERPARLKCLVGSCQSYFQTVRAMEKHLKTHNDCLAPYKCEFPGCEKLCYSSSALTAHTRCHNHKPEELTCTWQGCGRIFDVPCRLKAHMRQHTGDRPYICTYKDCKWAFSSSSKLKRHQHKHFGERRFRCTIGDCNKAFMRSEHLKDHTLTHIGSKTFKCPYCDESFSAKATLYVHKKKYHGSKLLENGNIKTGTASTSEIKTISVDVNANKSTVVKTNTIERKHGNVKAFKMSLPSTLVRLPDPPISGIKIEKPDDTVSLFETNILQPNSPSNMLSNLSNDDYELDSFKQEFSSLENIEPVISNPVQDDANKENSNLTKKKSKCKAIKKGIRKKGTFTTSESCARTYLAYHSNEIVFDEPSASSSPLESEPQSPCLTAVSTATLECVDSQSPGPSGINEVSQSSIATPEMVPIPQEIRDVSLIEADTMTISYNCDTNLSDASSEMLINYDNFQDSQQPIFFSNFILQDSENGTDLFASDENGEYVLLLDSTNTSSNFPESTINLRDLH